MLPARDATLEICTTLSIGKLRLNCSVTCVPRIAFWIIPCLKYMMEISDFIPTDGAHQRIYCSNCNSHCDLVFIEFDALVSGISIRIDGLPMLQCPSCGNQNLPDLSRFAIVDVHRRAMAQSKATAHVDRRKRTNTFSFTDVPFQYDCDDYWYIPGLHRSFDEGFLQPVFFKRAVLLKFDNSPGYRVRFASTTYGEITANDDHISFGVNRHRNVVMWLGDIAKLPKDEQFYLRSENVQSDHSIGSEFYDGQIEAKFTDPSAENALFKLRSIFIENFFKRFGRKIAHLEREALDLALSFNPPVVDTPKERRHVADSLNKIYLESIDNAALLEILKSLCATSKGTGSLKRMQAIFEAIAPTEDIKVILSPLYVLYDLRVAFSHLTQESTKAQIATIGSRLGIQPESELSVIYGRLIAEMTKCFEKLSKLLILSP
jgi:hypothetical protein